ncbi:MAG: HEAT repeat domain-containing protein [Candidatus Lokiarchaeota archaeon]|nr:HEAT repeat domain-containing protein [Candidatus Lokiarchaeota archaeon]
MSFWDIFKLNFEWNFYSILLTVGFVLSFIIGYILIYQQIHLVKAETMSLLDHFKCLLYGIIFSSGITIILTTVILFRINKKNIPLDTTTLSRFLLWPLNFVIFLLYIFPCIDFLYMAHSDSNKGVTIFQEFFAKKIIHKFEEPWKRSLVAITLWLGLFILPPLFLSMVIPLYIAFMGWSFVYPIIIIAYFGYRGYVTSVVKNVYTHHTMSRALHLAFDKSPRIFRILFYRFYTTVTLVIQIVTYFIMYLILIEFMHYFFVGDVLITVKGTPFQTFAISLSLLSGIEGYFSRFWKKKIKFRWIDVFLSSWLIASVGINLLVNFMILRIDNGISTILESWSVTNIITQTTTMKGGNYVLFIPVALIEEIMFIILVNYYLFSKNSKFFLEARLNFMEYCGSKFIPVPLFNFVHHSNSHLHSAAKQQLIQLYGRLPLRNDLKYTHKRYMYPLFDAISDSNKYNREVAQIILEDAIQNHPIKISPLILKALQSGNVDLQINVGNIIKKHPKFMESVPSSLITDFFNHPNYLIKRLGADLVLNLSQSPKSLNKETILHGITDGDHIFQCKCMEIAIKFGFLKDINEFLDKMKSSKSRIQQIAIQSFIGLIGQDNITLSNSDIEKLLDKLRIADGPSRDAAIISVSQLKNLTQYKIPYEPFVMGIRSHVQSVRKASQHVLHQLHPNLNRNEQSKIFNTFIKLAETADDETIQHIIPLLNRNWKQNPQKVTSIIMKFFKSSNNTTQNIIIEALLTIAEEDPELVLNSIVSIQEERTYLTKSVLQKTILQICAQNPHSIKILEKLVEQSNMTVKKNVLTAMEGLAEQYATYFNKDLLINSIKSQPFMEIRIKLLSVLSKIIHHHPEIKSNTLTELLPLLNSSERDIRKQTASIFLEIAQIKPSLITLDIIQNLSKDSDPSIRELSAKILRYYISIEKEPSLTILDTLLEDSKWIVQTAAIDALMQEWNLMKSAQITKIINMIDKSDEWLSRKALEFIQYVGKQNPELIPLRKITELTSHANPYLRSMILKIIELLPFDKAWEILKKLMQDKDSQIREQAARSLVTFSKDMTISTLFSYTLPYFSDETDIFLQRTIANALRRIVKYESSDVRNRLISILKIRCQVSQDPVLCRIWHKLEEK